MKAFTLKNYSEREIIIRQLLTKLQDHGHLNCDFDTFAKFYIEWHTKEFPGCTIAINTVISDDDCLKNFVEFLANKDIPDESSNDLFGKGNYFTAIIKKVTRSWKAKR